MSDGAGGGQAGSFALPMLGDFGSMLKRGDIALAIGVMAILVVLVLPLPAPLLDMSLAISIILSVLILMTALFIQAPLEFSAFPTVLLRAVALRGSGLRASRLRVTVNVQRSPPHQLLACERKTA